MSRQLLQTRERTRLALGAALALLATAWAGSALSQGPAGKAPHRVTIKDDKPAAVEADTEAGGPIDPVRRIQYNVNGLNVNVRSEDNQTLHLSHYPSFHIDDQIFQGQPPGAFQFMNRALPVGKGRKPREGFESRLVFNDLHITCTVTVVPTRAAARGAKRSRDSVLVHYLVENKSNRPRKFGLRVYMDVFVINNDGALFAAPTIPGKILDGMVLKDKQLPPYLQMLQVPDLKNPGYVAHMTFDLGKKIDRPDRIILTRFGAAGIWDMPVFQAMGDSAMGAYWEPKMIKPGGKREIAYGYGRGIVPSPENEGRIELALGGSFEPGKAFDVTAYVTDPAPGQIVTLELPAGMTLVRGPQLQPVPEAPGEEAISLVRWRARVERAGTFPLRVRSNTGVTQGKHITVSPAER
jgi:hypothetical protein